MARQIPRDCESLAKRVPLPPLKKGDDMRKHAARMAGAAVKANSRLDATAECQAGQREDFARGE